MLRKLLLLIVALLGASCATAPSPEIIAQTAQPLWSSPRPTPKFVRGLDLSFSQDRSVNRVCLELSQADIWEPGEYHTYERVVSTARVEVDGIAQGDTEIAQIATLLFRRDALGNEIGSHGGDISVCFNINGLRDGLHHATVTFQKRSGARIGYQWAFKTSTQNGKVVPQLTPTP
jgi:hypothetical protein